jgi:hypothetical protein
MVKVLLAHGADTDAQNMLYYKPAQTAEYYDNYNCLRIIREWQVCATQPSEARALLLTHKKIMSSDAAHVPLDAFSAMVT